MNFPEVFTIIVTYNGADTIAACLESVLASECANKIVVVDNASQDDTLAIVAGFPDVICLKQDKNHGFGVANNIGIRYALDKDADFVFLLNQDAYVQPDSIGKLVHASQDNPELGILSPVHLNETGSAIDALFDEYIQMSCPELNIELSNLPETGIQPLPFVNAAAWLIPIKCIRQVGGFDPIFFMRGEDNDYCNRVIYHGFQVGILCSATIRHERSMRSERDHAGFWRSVKWKTAKRKRQMMVALKHPGSSAWKHLLWWGYGILHRGLRQIVGLDFCGVIALFLASVSLCPKIPRIFYQRKKCIEGNMKWL